MTDSPYGVTPGGTWPQPGPPTGPPPAWPAPASKQSRAPVVISLIVALVAIAVAVGAWFRPTPTTPATNESSPQYSVQEADAAKEIMCSAYDKAYKAVTTAGGQTSDDPTVELIIALNVRLATEVASSYLTKTLDDKPATPPKLADDIRDISSTWDEVVLAQLASAPKDDLSTLYSRLDAANAQITQACT